MGIQKSHRYSDLICLQGLELLRQLEGFLSKEGESKCTGGWWPLELWQCKSVGMAHLTPVSSVPWDRSLWKAELFQSSLRTGLLGTHFQGRTAIPAEGPGHGEWIYHRIHLVCERCWTQYFILGCVQGAMLLFPKRPRCLHPPAREGREKVQGKLAMKEHENIENLWDK